MSISEALAMTQAVIMKLVADSVTAALEAQAANMANTDNTTRPREAPKMEDEFYHLTVKENDLKTYVRRFQELATLCPTMVPDFEKMMEVFIGGLPRCIEGNVTASKPQTLEEAINIALIDEFLRSLYKASLFGSIDGSGFKDDDVLLTRSLLAVPITGSLVIEARLTDLDSGDYILRGSRVFDSHCNGIFKVDIKYNDCTLKVQVTWSQD
ncbi:hypothetical protein Tco_1279407 [Tanacetum coccineum]